MNRRNFVRSSIAAGAILGSPTSMQSVAEKKNTRLWYELRTYHFTNEDQRQLTETYLEHAYLPALDRGGIGPAGVFTEVQSQDIAKLYLLVPFSSLQSMADLEKKLAHDTDYVKAGEAYLNAPASSPAYLRIDSSLLRAFVHMPAIDAPEKNPRIFELRCYESPSESAGQKKIEMFNDAGEIDIFKRVGARPVFFGETIIGERRPNLTYMLCFADMQAHDACWKAFGNDPDWKRLKGMDEYSDARLISKITRTFLAPTGYSRI
ncbi:MAG TPA: NIPSNAP family protein [Puia sp.]|nr:NIPSNAP family protein [Puia sp.]